MTIQDQIGKTINIPNQPLRIVSLVPSQTELLHYLGLEEEVVGITKFCIYPENWFRSKRRVGGTKQYHFDRIEALKPTLIIANKEENEKEQIEALSEKYPVWTSDISTLEEAYEMIASIGQMTNRVEKAEQLITDIKNGFERLTPIVEAGEKDLSAVYLIWRNPWMSVGSGTFIHHLLEKIGIRNALANQERYPVIKDELFADLKPDLILLSSEPYPFKAKHIEEIQALSPSSKIMLVDGESFSWYGSRLLYAVDYFSNLVEELRC